MHLSTLLLLSTLLTGVQSTTPPIGAQAPAFTVTDDGGRTVALSDYAGKFVVLEWHEKGCPYVTKHYRNGHMQRVQQAWMKRGVVWLLITSSAEGNHSYLTPAESRAYLASIDAAPTSHLLDTNGSVGRQYGVTTALHTVIVGPDGTVVYTGAIDDKPTTSGADLATARNYVSEALTLALSGKAVQTPGTTPYGCSVHYAR